jgi:cohesin complex subunit SCC1
MLLTELILSKKGPLAKVWISAHQERKLSKAQTLQVDVGETVGESPRRATRLLTL